MVFSMSCQKQNPGFPVQPNPCPCRDTHSRVLRAASRWLLKISKEKTPQPLGRLRQCSLTHTAQKCLRVFRGKFPTEKKLSRESFFYGLCKPVSIKVYIWR